MSHLAWLAVFFAIQPFLGALHGRKFENNDALRFPIAFEHFGLAAANNIFAAVLVNGCRGLLFVYLVADWIGYLDFDNHIRGHKKVENNLEARAAVVIF